MGGTVGSGPPLSGRPHNQRDSEGTEKASSGGGSLDHSLKAECAPVPPYQAPSENTAPTVYLEHLPAAEPCIIEFYSQCH